MTHALEGLRVVDAATLAAGPLVATNLGEYGAEVIKVEQPGVGDPLRTWGARRGDIGLVWKSVSRNKKCVTLDLRQPEGRELLHGLLDRSDVLRDQHPTEHAGAVGAGLSTSVHARHPRLVMVHVTGYGGGGPASDRPGLRHPGRGHERFRARHRASPMGRRRCRRSCSPTVSPRSTPPTPS